MNNKNDHKHMYDECKEHMHSYVLAETVDGSKIDGIITGLDDEYVYFAVPTGGEMNHEQWGMNDQYGHRQFGGYYGGGYGHPGHGYGHGGYGYGSHGYGYGSGGRFSRLVLPLAALTALSILPWY